MEFKTQKVEKYGAMVESHLEMDALRKSQCLCLNCDLVEICNQAHEFYSLCKRDNIALAVTRCPKFKRKSVLPEEAKEFVKWWNSLQEKMIQIGQAIIRGKYREQRFACSPAPQEPYIHRMIPYFNGTREELVFSYDPWGPGGSQNSYPDRTESFPFEWVFENELSLKEIEDRAAKDPA